MTSKSVGFSPFCEVEVFEVEGSSHDRGMWPVNADLGLELSLPLVPRYVVLQSLLYSESAVRESVRDAAKYDVHLDDIVVPLVEFLRRHSSRSLSRRLRAQQVYENACRLLEILAEELCTHASSAHHSLLRPIKDLFAFPGDVCEWKLKLLSVIQRRLFPTVPSFSSE